MATYTYPKCPLPKKANGANLGEMNMLLLKKAEELTLYLLEQNKINQAQEKEIAELKKNLRTFRK
jgi:hypothetical protein